MQATIHGKRYDTDKATIVAHDCYFDGRDYERHGRNVYLYRTFHGSYFALHLTQRQGELDYIEPLSVEEARTYWEQLPGRELEYAKAFPSVQVEDA